MLPWGPDSPWLGKGSVLSASAGAGLGDSRRTEADAEAGSLPALRSEQGMSRRAPGFLAAAQGLAESALPPPSHSPSLKPPSLVYLTPDVLELAALKSRFQPGLDVKEHFISCLNSRS